jgi:hypothetical protein
MSLLLSYRFVGHDLMQAFYHIFKDVAYFWGKLFTVMGYYSVDFFKSAPIRSNAYFAFIDEKALKMLQCGNDNAKHYIFVLARIAISDLFYI